MTLRNLFYASTPTNLEQSYTNSYIISETGSDDRTFSFCGGSLLLVIRDDFYKPGKVLH